MERDGICRSRRIDDCRGEEDLRLVGHINGPVIRQTAGSVSLIILLVSNKGGESHTDPGQSR